MSYFDDALADFVQNFAYGDAIRHLVDLGYTAERIKKEFEYPLSIEKIEKIVQDQNNKRRGAVFQQEVKDMEKMK